jgi:malonyl-CoA O-methyltransferase
LPATIELIFGHAWKGEPRRAPERLPDGRLPIHFDMNAKKRAAR